MGTTANTGPAPAKKGFRPFTSLVGAVENAAAGVLSGAGSVIQEVVSFIPAADRPAVEAEVKVAEGVLAEADSALASPAPVVTAPASTVAAAPVSATPSTPAPVTLSSTAAVTANS